MELLRNENYNLIYNEDFITMFTFLHDDKYINLSHIDTMQSLINKVSNWYVKGYTDNSLTLDDLTSKLSKNERDILTEHKHKYSNVYVNLYRKDLMDFDFKNNTNFLENEFLKKRLHFQVKINEDSTVNMMEQERDYVIYEFTSQYTRKNIIPVDELVDIFYKYPDVDMSELIEYQETRKNDRFILNQLMYLTAFRVADLTGDRNSANQFIEYSNSVFNTTINKKLSKDEKVKKL